MKQKMTILETKERIDELNNLVSEGWLEVSDLYKELAASPDNPYIKIAIEEVKRITRDNIKEAKLLENELANM